MTGRFRLALTPQLARALVDLRADEELQAEVELLRAKASMGTLSPNEEIAYKDFVEAVDVISIHFRGQTTRHISDPAITRRCR